jgi:hypothetical protein
VGKFPHDHFAETVFNNIQHCLMIKIKQLRLEGNFLTMIRGPYENPVNVTNGNSGLNFCFSFQHTWYIIYLCVFLPPNRTSSLKREKCAS